MAWKEYKLRGERGYLKESASVYLTARSSYLGGPRPKHLDMCIPMRTDLPLVSAPFGLDCETDYFGLILLRGRREIPVANLVCRLYNYQQYPVNPFDSMRTK
jgi:hypothetical protein